MATGGRCYNPKGDISLASGSEAVYDHVCQPCIDDYKTREAVGFCIDCADWLCDECFRIHTRPRPMRRHALKSLKEIMNSSVPLKQADKCTESCYYHSGKTLKYYCSSHKFLGCSFCIIKGHGTCKVDYIPEVCERSDIKEKFRQVTNKLQLVSNRCIEDIVYGIDIKEEYVTLCKTQTINSFKSYIDTLKESLDKVANSLEVQCKKKATEETIKLKNIAKLCESIEKERISMEKRLKDFESTGQHCNKFVALKQSEDALEILEQKQKYVKHVLASVTMYTFKPNKMIEEAITGAAGIGRLVEHFCNYTEYTKLLSVQKESKGLPPPGLTKSEIQLMHF